MTKCPSKCGQGTASRLTRLTCCGSDCYHQKVLNHATKHRKPYIVLIDIITHIYHKWYLINVVVVDKAPCDARVSQIGEKKVEK